MSDLPNHTYYRACHGSWRCTVDFALTDPRAFASASIGAMNRMRVWSLLWLVRLFGPMALHTSVDYESRAARNEVIHTTRAIKWGLPLLDSVEIISLADDGRRFTLHAEERSWPFTFLVHRYDGEGEIDASATRATYRLPWMGAELVQTTLREGDLVTATQATNWSRAVLPLRRVLSHPKG